MINWCEFVAWDVVEMFMVLLHAINYKKIKYGNDIYRA